MPYLLPIILIMMSYLFGTYFAYQGLRNEIDRPLAYSSEPLLLFLVFLFGWIPLFVSLYLAYIGPGLFFVGVLLVVRFIVMPTIFNEKIRKYLTSINN